MGETVAETWAVVAGDFGAVADAVEPHEWDLPAPCEGWTARQVVGHLAEWVPPFLTEGVGIDVVVAHSVEDDPSAAWHDLDVAIRSLLEDPEVHRREFRHPMAGTHPLDEAVERFITADVLVHTWDLATAVGRDVTLHPPTVAALLTGFEAMGDALAASGQFAPAVAVPESADPQTRLIAASGRRPVG